MPGVLAFLPLLLLHPFSKGFWGREGSKPAHFNLAELGDFRLVMDEEYGSEFCVRFLTFNLLSQ